MTPRPFGVLSDGRAVQAVDLGGPEGLRVTVLDYGAILQRLAVPTARGEVSVTLGFDDLAGYEADTAYHGAMIGRCANRIGGAQFTLDGVEHRVTANEGVNCLHGGRLGFGKRLWGFAQTGDHSVALTYAEPDGEEGFPGAVETRVEIGLADPWILSIAYEARCDAETPVSLTHHPYFNLSGDPASDILDHELTIAADAITPIAADLIPTGALMHVEATPFDFRSPRPLGAGLGERHPQLGIPKGYDHNWTLTPGAAPAVRLRSPRSGVTLEIETDQPGLQVFGGQSMGAPFHPYAAVVLEPQAWPDAVNHANFPGVTLRPGETYRRRSLYRFEAGAPG